MTNKQIKMHIDQFHKFPGSRFMGSKNKIIGDIWNVIKDLEFNSFFDAFGGSNVVGYYLKTKNKQVITNDFMNISYLSAKAIIENSNILLGSTDLDFILSNENEEDYISKTFKNIYFTDEENNFLDKTRHNISLIDNVFKRAIAISALVKSCIKKRPRGIFTYIGNRYNDGRKDLNISLENHFINNVEVFNQAIFNNGLDCKSHNELTENLNIEADLVYFDPPYFTLNSDNDYVRRYHFVEGLTKNWVGLKIQEHTKTKKFKSYKSQFSNRIGAYSSFKSLIEKYKNSIIVISYSSNSYPTKDEMVDILCKYKDNVETFEINHTYSFGNQNHKKGNKYNRVKEYLFIGK